MRIIVGTFLVVILITVSVADVVVPSDDVTNGVIVREGPSSQTDQVGSLHNGQQAQLVGSVPNWHEVQLANGVTGFVSKRWTHIISEPPTPPNATAPTFTLDIVDVGTGLGVLVRGPDFTLVYDGGSNDDLARGLNNRMLAYLRAVSPSLSVIDHIVLSHPHRDHVELLPDIFAAYEVRQVWDSGRVNDICGYRAFLTAIRNEAGVQYHNALQDFGVRLYPFVSKNCYGQSLPEANLTLTHASRITDTPITLGQTATMTILHANGATGSGPNENSLVVRLDLGPTRVLFMGDAEAGGRKHPAEPPSSTSIESHLLTCCATNIAANVLVVGHHGSKTSSRRAFLDAVGASLFVVSSGPMQYGSVVLPDAEVITELTTRGQVLRTDVNDTGCATNTAKIGPDNDGRAGGCDNIRLTITGTAVQSSVWHGTD